jgi:hypothetical protein
MRLPLSFIHAIGTNKIAGVIALAIGKNRQILVTK